MGDYVGEVIDQVREEEYDRDRSRQKELGWSAMSGCRAYMGFVLREQWATDDRDEWRAVCGTALHGWLGALRERAAVAAGERVLFEHATQFGGVPGHADEINVTRRAVTDYKFPSMTSAAVWRDPEVLAEKMIQPHGYAAGIVGHWLADGVIQSPDEVTVRLFVAPVDGTFADWWSYEEPFNPEIVAEALARYEQVKEAVADGDPLPQDKDRWWCERFCEFFTVCREGEAPEPKVLPEIQDVELAAAVETYGEAHERRLADEKVEKRLRPLIHGLRGKARGWQISTGKGGTAEVVDMEQIKADYAESGLELPRVSAPRAGQLRVTRVKTNEEIAREIFTAEAEERAAAEAAAETEAVAGSFDQL